MQTCDRDESCQSESLHAIAIWNVPLNVCGSVTETSQLEIFKYASLGDLNFGVRLMNWASCGVSNMD